MNSAVFSCSVYLHTSPKQTCSEINRQNGKCISKYSTNTMWWQLHSKSLSWFWWPVRTNCLRCCLVVCSACQREKVCSFVALWWFFFCPFLNSKRVQGLGVAWGNPDLPFQPALVPFGGWSKQDSNCSCTIGQCHGAPYYHPIHHDNHDSECGQHDCGYYCNNCYVTSGVKPNSGILYFCVSDEEHDHLCSPEVLYVNI